MPIARHQSHDKIFFLKKASTKQNKNTTKFVIPNDEKT